MCLTESFLLGALLGVARWDGCVQAPRPPVGKAWGLQWDFTVHCIGKAIFYFYWFLRGHQVLKFFCRYNLYTVKHPFSMWFCKI